VKSESKRAFSSVQRGSSVIFHMLLLLLLLLLLLPLIFQLA
jgi:hypothetical protein